MTSSLEKRINAAKRPDGDNPLGTMTNLLAARGEKGGKLVSVLAASTAGWQMGKAAWARYEKYQNDRRYSIALSSEDEIYDAVHSHVLSLMPPVQQRSLRIRTFHKNDLGRASRRSFNEMVGRGDSTSRKVKRLGTLMSYDGQKQQPITLDGHKINIYVEIPEGAPPKGPVDSPGANLLVKFPRLVFSASSMSGRDAVVRMIKRIAAEVEEEVAPGSRLFVANSWGGFLRQDTLPRPLETVVLEHGQIEDLLADMERFLDAEKRYAELGLPWHRGYLFHGPPGTGKTSIAKALANHFNIDLYYMPIADIQKDNDFQSYMRDISDSGILLLEDIDVLHAASDRDHKENEGLSLAGLLNALDGVATPHGMITIMTTNHIDALDDALRRPGRADKTMEITYLTQEQAVRVCELIAGRPVDASEVPPIPEKLTPATLLEVAKENLEEPEKSLGAVINFLKETQTCDA